MAVQRGAHPSADVLKAFASGKLSDTSADAVVTHLDQCHQCSQEVAKTSAGPTPVSHLPPELAANQQYEILRELGRGGMGVVYLAKNKLMDRLEVLKVVNKALLDHPGAVERFLREIRSAAKLSHTNVVGAYHALQQGELLAFAMEYVEGQDLANLVKSQGPLPVPHACFYVQQAASGLQHAFEKGMVHRDIKPQNLILAREGKKHIVKVLDFGLAKATSEKKEDTGLTGEGKMLGTPDYIAPEQSLDAAKADIRADIYSLGCTLYYLLSGHPPFSGASLGAILLAHQMQEAKALNLVRPEVPEELAAVVQKMMAKTPAQRYQTPLEVVQALSPFVKQGTVSKAAPQTQEAKPAVKLVTPVVPPPGPPEVWGSLTAGSSASTVSRKSAIVRKPPAATVRERTAQKKWLIGGGLGVLLLTLLGMWAGGMFEGKVHVKTKDGILVIEVNEPNPEVLVDGEKVTVSWHNGGKKAEIHVNPGTHKVEIQKDGFSVDGKELTFKDGDRVILTARLLPEKPEKGEAKADAPPSDKPPPPPDTKKSDVPRVAEAADGDKGFVQLFNGKDLSGWKTHPTQPGDWRVKDGILISSGRAISHLYSERGDYRDFHLRVETRINPTGDSGVEFRTEFGPSFPVKDPMHPLGYEAQIYGDEIKPGWPSSTGSLYATGTGPVVSLRKSPKLSYKWFTLEVLAEGNHIVLKMDGQTTADYTDDKRRFSSGHIALQQHNTHTVVEFRKIEIKELLPAAASSEPPKQAANANGFVPLFNGKDLTGWKTHPDAQGNWKVEGGVLIGRGPEKSWLYSQRDDYENFHLLVEAKINQGGNSGVQFHKAFTPNVTRGYEAQIDSSSHKFKTGTLYIKGAPGVGIEKVLVPVDTWFTQEVIFQGNRIIIKINGEKTADFVDAENTWPRGHIALQVFDAPTVVQFRRIAIKELAATRSETPPAPKPESRPAAKSEPPRATAGGTEEKGFVQLFNGKDLKGWKTHAKQPGNWHVEKEVLIGSGSAISHLYSSRGNYKNFHLRVVARINDGNSGVYFRATFGPVRPPNNPIYPQGYEAQISANSREPRKTGSLFGMVQVSQAPHKPNEWFTMDVIADGNHIVIKVNDKITADYRDDKRLYTGGHIALQQIDAATVVEFRKIEIKEHK
ncbi:MAG TPA: family 16 glycoside hydrolase [Gemmataceae bacterium]